jgi:DNA-binding MarR family transcriptional regulator
MKTQVDKVNLFSASNASDVLEVIHTIMHLVRARQHRALRDSEAELTHMEHKVLGFFARHPGATQSALVSHSGRDKAQLTRLIRGLKDKGLLTAQTDATERRNVQLQLTAAGEHLQKSLRALDKSVASLATGSLSATDCEQLLKLLRQVRGNLESEPADVDTQNN